MRTGFEPRSPLAAAEGAATRLENRTLTGPVSLACVETSSLRTGFEPRSPLAAAEGAATRLENRTLTGPVSAPADETSLSKLLNMLYFNASAIYGGEAPLPQPLANEINSLNMQSMSSLLREGKAHINFMRNVVRSSTAWFASKFITASFVCEPLQGFGYETCEAREAANYLIRIT